MPETGVENLGHEHILQFEEIERIVKATAALGIHKYRITGGEPLVRKGIVGLVENLSAIPGVETLTMTSNGILLNQYAVALKKAGLDRLNISLDTLNHTKFKNITRGGDLDQAIAGINAATKAGFKNMKLNVVAMKGFNDDEIMDFIQLTYQYDYQVRFIELMPIGHADTGREYEIITTEEMKKKLPALKPLDSTDGVAEIFKYPGAKGTIGFISPMSCQFCTECNKIRLTADGKIKTCLHSNQEVDLMPILKTKDDELLKETLKNAILAKEDRHYLNDGAMPIDRDMNKIGG